MNQPPVPSWLDDPRLARLWASVHERLERNGLVATGSLTLQGLTRDERHAVGDVLGRTLTKDRVTVDLAALDLDLTRRSGIGGLVAVTEAVTGTALLSRPAQRTARVAEREAPFVAARDWLRRHPVPGAEWAEPWLGSLRRSGVLTGIADAAQLACQALQVLTEITRQQTVRTRTALAAEQIGNAHALDDGTVLAHLVLRGLAIAADTSLPRTTHERRSLWDRFGVSSDSVSSTCLLLGLRATGTGGPAARINAAANDGDPLHLTARDLRRLDGFASVGAVLVCENPAVLEAAADHAGGSVAVVCSSGQPALVVLDVLGRLRAAGCELRYHGDFDWPGIAIANRLVEQLGVQPWLMSAADYRAACPDAGLPLAGTVVPPSWDLELGGAMQRTGIAVHEEAVLTQLLNALPISG